MFFTKVLTFHASSDKSDKGLASALKVNPYFLRDYKTAAGNYPLKKVINIFSDLRHADLQSKGVNAANLPDGQILRELIFKIMH